MTGGRTTSASMLTSSVHVKCEHVAGRGVIVSGGEGVVVYGRIGLYGDVRPRLIK